MDTSWISVGDRPKRKRAQNVPSAVPRVMMVLSQYPYPVVGGLERQAHELAKALREQGIKVQVLSGKVQATQPALEAIEGVPVYRIRWSPHKSEWLHFLRTPFDLFRILYARRSTYDVIHLHQHSWFGLFVIVAAGILGKPILTKLPNVGEFGIPGLRAQRFGRLKLAILTRSDGLVAMSQESLDEFRRISYPVGRILTTPNGIRLSIRRSVATMDRLQPHVACRVVFVGRLDEQKGIDILLEAWREVVNLAEAVPVLELWGDGPLLSELRELCVDLGISDSVILRGYVDDVRDRLGIMDVFVLPSRAEGNSNVILEAMDAGLPIVSTRVGGTPMLVGRDGDHFLCQPNDAGTLTIRLIELIDNPDLRATLGEAMRRRVVRHFNIHQVAQTYGTAYRFFALGQRERVHEASNPVILDEPSCAD